MQNLEWVNHIGATAALKILGHDIKDIRINPTNPMRTQTQFGFEPSDELRTDLERYWAGEVMVPSMMFYNTINELRKRRFDLETIEKAKQPFDENLNNLRS